ncbi:MAG: hypothetical protein HC903_09335 [Methylacidiphilales bacterium]|nr:hypothetical protein [Candidatus Methylacidiphilales bacterium]
MTKMLFSRKDATRWRSLPAGLWCRASILQHRSQLGLRSQELEEANPFNS